MLYVSDPQTFSCLQQVGSRRHPPVPGEDPRARERSSSASPMEAAGVNSPCVPPARESIHPRSGDEDAFQQMSRGARRHSPAPREVHGKGLDTGLSTGGESPNFLGYSRLKVTPSPRKSPVSTRRAALTTADVLKTSIGEIRAAGSASEAIALRPALTSSRASPPPRCRTRLDTVTPFRLKRVESPVRSGAWCEGDKEALGEVSTAAPSPKSGGSPASPGSSKSGKSSPNARWATTLRPPSVEPIRGVKEWQYRKREMAYQRRRLEQRMYQWKS